MLDNALLQHSNTPGTHDPIVEEHLIRGFIAEAEEYLRLLEPNLLRLEQEPDNTELLNDIFLAVHSIKGTAAYVGLAHISSFTHALESLLDRVRKHELRISPDLIDSLLQGLDMVKTLIYHVSLDQPAPDTSTLLALFARWQETPSEANTRGSQNSRNSLFHDEFPQQIDPDDLDIFLDIAQQQIEFMRIGLETLRESLAEPADSDDQKTHSTLLSCIRAFKQLQSSARSVTIPSLEALFAEHDPLLDELEQSEAYDIEQVIPSLEKMLGALEQVIEWLAAHNPPEEEAEVSEEKNSPNRQPQSFSLSTPVDMSHSFRVNAERVDELLNLVGELVINRARLVQISQDMKTFYEAFRMGESDLFPPEPGRKKESLRMLKRLKERFDESVTDLERLTNQLQEGAMDIRMVPIGQMIGSFPRMVRDLSRQAGKDIQVNILGAETELDKTVVDILNDPLVHIIRNAVDHGIEKPEERQQQGKPAQGTITLSAYHEGEHVIIEIQDDGQGIDVQRVKQKAVEQGLLHERDSERLDEYDALQLIFHAGFSTVETISNLSGRGVGLDVVRRYLEKINGSIDLQTRPGEGCLFTMKLPLTLAIIPALLVGAQDEIFAIPLTSVEEVVSLSPHDIHTPESHTVIQVRDHIIPLFALADLLGLSGSPHTEFSAREEHEDSLRRTTEASKRVIQSDSGETGEKHYGVIISDGFREIGLRVDSILGENDIVIKSLNHELIDVKGFSGASIQGDGKVSLVIDVGALIDLAIPSYTRSSPHTVTSEEH